LQFTKNIFILDQKRNFS